MACSLTRTSSTFLLSFALVSNSLIPICSANLCASSVSTTFLSGQSSLLPTIMIWHNDIILLFQVCNGKVFELGYFRRLHVLWHRSGCQLYPTYSSPDAGKTMKQCLFSLDDNNNVLHQRSSNNDWFNNINIILQVYLMRRWHRDFTVCTC